MPFKIFRSGGAAPAITLDLSPFANEQGVTAPVQFRLDGTSGAGATHLDMVATDKPVIPVDLLVRQSAAQRSPWGWQESD